MTKEAVITIDAKNKKLGRLASQTALALRGKTTADYLPHRTQLPHVLVINADAIDISTKKLEETLFQRYSGYPSGRKLVRVAEVARQDMREVIRHAVWGMLPKNKLRDRMIKNLTLHHGDKS